MSNLDNWAEYSTQKATSPGVRYRFAPVKMGKLRYCDCCGVEIHDEDDGTICCKCFEAAVVKEFKALERRYVIYVICAFLIGWFW